MATTVPREYLQALTQAIDAIIDGGKEAARAVLDRLLADSDATSPFEVAEQVAEAVEPVIQSVTDGTSALSAQSYDAIRMAATGEALGAIPYDGRDSEWTKRAIWGIAGEHRGNMEAFVQGVIDRVDYEAKRAAGRTTFQNGKNDPKRPRYARVPTGPETCRFCVMLASRGFVYHSEQSAGALDHYHPNCDCRIVPGYEGMTVDGYDPDEYLKLWQKMEDEGIAKLENPGADASSADSGAGVTIDATSPVYSALRPEYVDTIRTLFESGPDANRAVYKRFEGDFRLHATKSKKGSQAYFSPSDNAVRLDPDVVFGDGDRGPKLKGNTWFHEFGHSIDYMSTGMETWYSKLARIRDEGFSGRGRRFTYASVAYKDGLFGKTIKREVDARVKAEWDTLKKEKKDVVGLLQSLDFGTMRERGYISERQQAAFERMLRTSEEYAQVRGTSAGAEFMASHSVKNFISDYAKKSHAYERVSQEIYGLDHSHNDAISDIFEGQTKAKVSDFWGHGKAYWKDQDNVATEAFAEFFSAEMVDPEAVGLIERYFPESKKVFDELVEAIAEGVDVWHT